MGLRLTCVLALWGGCTIPDGGTGAPADAVRDAGPARVDAGRRDAGGRDAGPSDAGAPDAGPPPPLPFVPAELPGAPPGGHLALDDGAALDTTSGTVTPGLDPAPFVFVATEAGPDSCAGIGYFVAETITVRGAIVATGARALALVATRSLTIEAGAHLDASGALQQPGPGGFAGAEGDADGLGPGGGARGVVVDNCCDGGGGGGGHAGGGGAGGTARTSPGGAGGAATGGFSLLCGGSGGGPAFGLATGSCGPPRGSPSGGGGGAVLLAARGRVEVAGAVDVGGAGGRGAVDCGGGGGGGAGGMIVVAGHEVVVSGTLAAGGGGGGGGAARSPAGGDGADGCPCPDPALGGAAGRAGGGGGGGGAGISVDGVAGSPSDNNGGGGGGAAGRIRIVSAVVAPVLTATAVLNPDPTSDAVAVEGAPGLP